MEYRIGIEKDETNKYSVKTLEYIKGILHSFANLNEPSSNLGFDYEIVEFEKSNNISKSLKKRFYIFDNQQIELVGITQDTFLNKLKVWFYSNGELRNIQVSERKQEDYLNHFLRLLKDILDITEILGIENLKSENEKVYLELGIDYDYFVLNSPEKNYILYFTFCD